MWKRMTGRRMKMEDLQEMELRKKEETLGLDALLIRLLGGTGYESEIARTFWEWEVVVLVA